jgi:hypothetical protein
MFAALLLSSVVAAAAPPAPPAVVSLEARLSAGALARRLLLASADAPRREARESGLPLAVDERGGAKPEIVVDLTRLDELPPGEAEAEYARALARAAVAAPLPLVEAEQAVRQWTAQILVETALEDAAVSKALQAALNGPASGAPELQKAARFLTAFEKDPAVAWAAVEAESASHGAARLVELEDLHALRSMELGALRAPPEEPYVVLGDRRYPAPLVAAALHLREPGALAAVRESLGAFDTAGVAPLKSALARWRRSLPAR